jgi:hypothetical protein
MVEGLMAYLQSWGNTGTFDKWPLLGLWLAAVIPVGFLMIRSDLKKHIIPNSMVLIIAIWGLLFGEGNIPFRLVVGVLTLAILCLVAHYVTRALGKSAMGGGDIKLIVAFSMLSSLTFMGAALGAIVQGIFRWGFRDNEYPIAPGLVAGALVGLVASTLLRL